MALNVADILKIPIMEHSRLVAGRKGLSRQVTSVGFADWEWIEQSHPDFQKDIVEAFEPGQFVFTNLVFAVNDISMIMKAVKDLSYCGISCLCYKTALFQTLPRDVLEFCEEHDLPVIAYGRDIFVEDAMFSVMEAVRAGDNAYLTEETMTRMITDRISATEVRTISREVSVRFKPWAQGVFLAPAAGSREWDADRIVRRYYLNKGLHRKSIISRYRDGILCLITAGSDDPETYRIILGEIMDVLSIRRQDVTMAFSGIYVPYDHLDRCVREAYHAYVGQRVLGASSLHYDELGSLRFLIPMSGDVSALEFSDRLLEPLEDSEHYMETARAYVACSGDAPAAAAALQCHVNTVRYRMGRIKAMIGRESISDSELFRELSLALDIRRIREIYVV